MPKARLSGIALLFMAAAQAQSFDVASIRVSDLWKAGGDGGNSRSQIEVAPDGLTLRNIDLTEMVLWAYQLQPFQVSIKNRKDTRYDVRATSAARVSPNIMRAMLQDLLATRFKLVAHREPKETSVFELVIANGGAKLPPDKSSQLPEAYPKENLPRVVDGAFVFVNTTLPEFAEQLSHLRPIAQPVIDRTGIKGTYDITLKSAPAAILQPDGPSLFTLIQEQLGLRLISAKDRTAFLVVDRFSEPSEN